AAPPGVSDRVFRFNYLRNRLASGLGLAGFAFERASVPESMTRLRAVARTAPDDLPLLLMDTAPAAVLGALEDAAVPCAAASNVDWVPPLSMAADLDRPAVGGMLVLVEPLSR